MRSQGLVVLLVLCGAACSSAIQVQAATAGALALGLAKIEQDQGLRAIAAAATRAEAAAELAHIRKVWAPVERAEDKYASSLRTGAPLAEVLAAADEVHEAYCLLRVEKDLGDMPDFPTPGMSCDKEAVDGGQ